MGLAILMIILAAILTEALCQLWVDGLPVQPLRRFVKSFSDNKHYQEFLDCKYCQSVWLGWVVAYVAAFIYMEIKNIEFHILFFAIPFFVGIIIHRLSNYLHAVYDLIYSKSKEGELDLTDEEVKTLSENLN